MNEHEATKLYEVEFDAAIQNVYIAADSKHELLQIIGGRYDQERFNFSWRDFEVVDEVERAPASAVKGKQPPHRVLWSTNDGVRGLEKRANMGGSKGLYWI